MICKSCSKLSLLKTQAKLCFRCRSSTNYSCSVICEQCSRQERNCEICLKKVLQLEQVKSTGGCRSCGGG